MKVAAFSARPYDRAAFEAENLRHGHELGWFEARLEPRTAPLATGHAAVCAFVDDRLDAATLRGLAAVGVRVIALRSAGYNHVDLVEADRLDLPVVRVPEYSPHAVAEHAVALTLALIRKLHRAHARVREWNFALDGLVGFDLHDKTVGIVGTGRIGRVAARIFAGFGCTVVAHDQVRDPALSRAIGLRYVGLPELLRSADVISLHLPLTPQTHHLLDAAALAAVRPGVVLVNTGRGALIDSRALIAAIKDGRVGAAGLDVYEEEEGVFFRDLSDQVLQDDVLARLIAFPNTLVTAHQGFLTREALAAIARTTLDSLTAFEQGRPLVHRLSVADVAPAAG